MPIQLVTLPPKRLPSGAVMLNEPLVSGGVSGPSPELRTTCQPARLPVSKPGFSSPGTGGRCPARIEPMCCSLTGPYGPSTVSVTV